jgi:hypothetical protein
MNSNVPEVRATIRLVEGVSWRRPDGKWRPHCVFDDLRSREGPSRYGCHVFATSTDRITSSVDTDVILKLSALPPLGLQRGMSVRLYEGLREVAAGSVTDPGTYNK